MNTAMIIGVSACLVAFSVTACTSGPNAHPVRAAAATTPPAVTAGDSKTLADVPYGFQLVVQKGEEYYCKRELITGSRTNTRDVCLTKAQMQAQINGTQDYLKRMQDATNGADSRQNPNGTYNSAITR